MTEDFIQLCETELDTINKLQIDPIDREALTKDWHNKMARVRDSDQRWGLFFASK